MKKSIPYLLGFIILLSISCQFLIPSVNPAEVQSIVAATLTAFPTAIPTHQDTQVIPPMDVPTILPEISQRPPELRVVFIGPDKNLYAWARSNGTSRLYDTGDVNDLKISQDGTLIAFIRQSENQQSSLWLCGFDGSNPREVMTWNDLITLRTNPDNIGTAPSNLQWIPGTHKLTFSTRELFEGPGMALNDDLIVVDGDSGIWDMLLKPGQGGVATFSPDGKWMALSTAKTVSIMDVNGVPAPGRVLEFKPVATYSEYQYYPIPVWTPDGSRLGVFIPTAEPLGEPRQPGSIWSMDTQGGEPVLQYQLTPQFIGPVTLSSDLQRLFYVKEIGLPVENRRELRTVKIAEQMEAVIYSGDIPVTYDWDPDGQIFAFQTSNTAPVSVSYMNGAGENLANTDGAYWFTWVDSNRFLYSRVTSGMVELYLGDRKEGYLSLAALPVSDYFKALVDFAR